jgi:hypothetical protein
LSLIDPILRLLRAVTRQQPYTPFGCSVEDPFTSTVGTIALRLSQETEEIPVEDGKENPRAPPPSDYGAQATRQLGRLRDLELSYSTLMLEFSTLKKIESEHSGLRRLPLSPMYDVLHPPPHLFNSRPLIVCFWRVLQASAAVAEMWSMWAKVRDLVVWTELTSLLVATFLHEVAHVILGSLNQPDYSLGSANLEDPTKIRPNQNPKNQTRNDPHRPRSGTGQHKRTPPNPKRRKSGPWERKCNHSESQATRTPILSSARPPTPKKSQGLPGANEIGPGDPPRIPGPGESPAFF